MVSPPGAKAVGGQRGAIPAEQKKDETVRVTDRKYRRRGQRGVILLVESYGIALCYFKEVYSKNGQSGLHAQENYTAREKETGREGERYLWTEQGGLPEQTLTQLSATPRDSGNKTRER